MLLLTNKYMEFIHENDALEILDRESRAKQKINALCLTKWNDIAKVVLTKDNRLLERVLSETNPAYRNKLLDKPFITDIPK